MKVKNNNKKKLPPPIPVKKAPIVPVKSNLAQPKEEKKVSSQVKPTLHP